MGKLTIRTAAFRKHVLGWIKGPLQISDYWSSHHQRTVGVRLLVIPKVQDLNVEVCKSEVDLPH